MSEFHMGFFLVPCLSELASMIICWKLLSPVFSLTHWMPLGEKIENPDDDPLRKQH